jgi:hypothetical protein
MKCPNTPPVIAAIVLALFFVFMQLLARFIGPAFRSWSGRM